MGDVIDIENNKWSQFIKQKKLEVAMMKDEERNRIRQLVDQLIRDTEDCPLYEGEEREWLIGAYYTVRRLVAGDTDQDLPRYLD